MFLPATLGNNVQNMLRVGTAGTAIDERVGLGYTNSTADVRLAPANTISTAPDGEREPVHVVYSSSMESIAGVEASIRSVRAHSSGPIQFYFIGYRPLPSMPEVHWFNLSEISSKYNLHDFMNTADDGRGDDINQMVSNYARFAVDSIMMNRTDKVMYLDVDTIVLCDVYSIVNGALNSGSDYAIAAVPRKRRRSRDGKTAVRGLTEHGANALGGRRIRKSFNAGVYVMNVKVWREQNLTERMRHIALRNKKEHLYKYGSQPPMNIVIGDEFEDLPGSWNRGAGDYESFKRRNSTHETCLIHYKGGIRPWDNKESSHNGREEWLRYGVPVNTAQKLL